MASQLLSLYIYQVAAVQLGPKVVSIDCFTSNFNNKIRASIQVGLYFVETVVTCIYLLNSGSCIFTSQVHGVAVGTQAAAVWNGKLVEVYEVSDEKKIVRCIGKSL